MRTRNERSGLAFRASLLSAPLIFGVVAAVGCASPQDGPPGSGGSSSGGATSTGGSSSGGATSTGGSSSGGATSTGGSSSGGATSSGGSSSGGSASGGSLGTGGADSSSGGSAQGGSTGAKGGTSANGGKGGATSTGSGGSTGGGGTTGKPAAMPSSGCGKANPAVGSGSSPLTVSSHKYYVKLPTSYDASKPYLLLFMFNPTGNPITWAEQNAGFESGVAKTDWIRVYPDPASESSGWGAGDVSFFKPLYDQVTGAYCVDKARVFASGESSGGDFSSILGCEYANVLRGVAPCSTKDVGQYPLDATKRKCTGEVASVVIHGKNDNVVGPANGPKTRDFYVALNHCSTASPMPVQGYTDTLSNCVLYQGCDAGYPVYWCNHTDPNYSGTNHGWPAFAPKFLQSLFSTY